MEADDYAKRKAAEIASFKKLEDFSALSDIASWWAPLYLGPRVKSIFGTNTPAAFYGAPIQRIALGVGTVRILSVGSGDGHMECKVAAFLKRNGTTNFKITGVELSAALVERAKKRAAESGVDGHVEFIENDAKNLPGAQVEVIICNQILHHITDLEELFEALRRILVPGGTLLTRDMIGRNGHLAWPEALELINHIWTDMPKRYQYHHGQKRSYEKFPNIDFSKVGFEGIRCQDILPLMVKEFRFRKFYAFGGIVERFISLGFGPNYDAKNEDDLNFVRMLQVVNDLALDTGVIKPTQMIAELTNEETNCQCWGKRTPEFCVRDTAAPPY